MASTKKKPTKEAGTDETPKVKKSLFATFTEVDKAVGPGDLVNLEMEEGKNKFRIINDGPPMMIRKHWNLPQTAEATAVTCLKAIPAEDIPAFTADPEKYLAEHPVHCPWCDYEADWGRDADRWEGDGKDKSMYDVRYHHVFSVVQDGVVKVAEFNQRSILKGLAALEEDDDWAELMGDNGICDLEVIVTMKIENKRTSYQVGASPSSKPLSDEELTEYRKQALDLARIKAPPTDEDKIKELMKKAPEPKEGDKPKVARK